MADTSLSFKLWLQCHFLREAINDQQWRSWAPPHHLLHYTFSYGTCFFLQTIYKLWNFLFICLLLIFPSVKPILFTVISLRPGTVVPAVDRINVGSVEIKRRTLINSIFCIQYFLRPHLGYHETPLCSHNKFLFF